MFYLIVVRLWHVTRFVLNFFVDLQAAWKGQRYMYIYVYIYVYMYLHISRRSASGELSEIQELGQRLLFVSVT